MNGSTVVTKSLQDTLRIMQIGAASTIPDEYLGLLGVILGASIAILGNILLARRQAQLEIHKSLFLRRLDVYVKLIELLWSVVHSTRYPNPKKTPVLMIAPLDLSNWLNNLGNYVTSNMLLIDSATLDAYTELSKRTLDDIKATQQQGIKLDIIIERCDKTDDSARQYFKKIYKVEL